jgi:hypothetical protein
VLKPGVVATGELASSDGKTSGHIVVTARDDGNFDVTMSDFHTPITSELDLGLSPAPLTSKAACPASNVYLSFGGVSPGPARTFFLEGVTDFTRGNPSFFDAVLLTQLAPDPSNPLCAESVAAAASLAWTMPDMRPSLVVVDSGIRSGATGVAAIVGGKAASYVVASDDVMEAIAQRFGITVDDILYLNPTRMGGTMALAGETLNLSKKLR